MKKVICFVMAMFLLSTQAFAATYYDINVKALTYSEKENLVKWLEDKGIEYDVESYTSTSSKVIIIDKLSESKKDTFVSWLESKGYSYSTKKKNGYYYVTVEYTNSTKTTLVNYLESKNYDYGSSINSSSSDRTGQAYLVANGTLWYADGDDIEKVDTIYSVEYVLFTDNGAISYINGNQNGILIDDVEEPTNKERIVKTARSITTNSSGYATYFKTSTATSKGTAIYSDEDENVTDNEKVTVYIVKNNMLYSLSPKNKLNPLKTVSKSTRYSKSYSNIAFSQYGDLTFMDSNGIVYFNENIDKPSQIELLKDENNRTVKARYLNIENGITKTVTLENGSTVKFEP